MLEIKGRVSRLCAMRRQLIRKLWSKYTGSATRSLPVEAASA